MAAAKASGKRGPGRPKRKISSEDEQSYDEEDVDESEEGSGDEEDR